MPIQFQGSKEYTIGVELELQLVDPKTFDLVPKSADILQQCKMEGVERVSAEVHQSMIEINTEISGDIKECRKFLMKRLRSLISIAESQDVHVAALGTHPSQKWPDRLITNQDRYQYLHQKFQWLTRRMNVYGLHVHIGLKDEEQVLRILRNMACYLPHLLALSANSPFWQGVDTGMQSCRVNIMESFPFAGLPYPFQKWQDFEYYHDTMKSLGVIDSLKDLYWFIRPNLNYGTIEFRICDALTTLEETLALVALIHCLVIWLEENPPVADWSVQKQWIAPENQWVAARDGLDGMIIMDLEGKRSKISEEIIKLLDQLEPIGKKLNCLKELGYIKHILAKGNGAARQRAQYAKTHIFSHLVAQSVNALKESVYSSSFST